LATIFLSNFKQNLRFILQQSQIVNKFGLQTIDIIKNDIDKNAYCLSSENVMLEEFKQA